MRDAGSGVLVGIKEIDRLWRLEISIIMVTKHILVFIYRDI